MSAEGGKPQSGLITTESSWGNLPTRLGSALVIASLVFVVLWFGGWVWGLALAVIGARMAYEWARMSQPHAVELGSLLLAIPTVVTVLLYLLAPTLPLAWIGLAAAIALPIVIPGLRKGWAVTGAVYIIVPVICMLWLRNGGTGWDSIGFKRVVFVIAVVIAADVGAYFAGKSIGGPKLAPKLSPKKTWAGLGGGLALGGLVAGLLSELISDDFFHGVLVGLTLVIAAVVGDFLESGFKRRFGVKDAGSLLPGHGGVLDRIDSHMAAMTKAALIIAFASGLYPF